MTSKKDKGFGKWAELQAQNYLKSKGYKILDTNIRFQFGEIDILALDSLNEELVVVEVKARHKNPFQDAIESVSYYKLKRLIKCGYYIVDKLKWDKNWRIDLIAIDVLPEDKVSIKHLKDITYGFYF